MASDEVHEEFEQLPFPARRTRPVKLDIDVPEDPFGAEFSGTLEETAPQDEVLRRAEGSRRGTKIPKFPTVETMYAAYPDIHRAGKIRVVRTEPKWWVDTRSGQRIRVNGILTKHEAPISTDDIERRFGGYKYEVFGMLEKFDQEDPGGPPRLVDVAVAEFEIPMDPVSEHRPIEEDQVMFPLWNRRGGNGYPQQQQQQYPHSSGEWGQVLQFAKEMAKGNGDNTPNTAFETLARQGEMSTQQLQELARQQISALERRNERLESSIQEMQSRMHEKPDNLGSIIQGVAALNQSTRTSASSEELQVLRDQHEREMARLREDHRSDVDRLGRERDREVDRIRIDADARVERTEDKLKDLRESFERREREVRDEFERRERQFRDEQQRQFETQAQNYERRIDDMRQNHDREVRMLKNMQDNTVQTTVAAHGVELRAAQGELAKLTAELTQKQALVDAAIADKNRPLMDQVAEIKNLADALNLTSDNEQPPAPPTAENAPLYEKLIMGLIQKADTLLPQLSALTGKGTPAQQQQGQPGVPPQIAAMAPPSQLPPRPERRMSFADSSGPPVMRQEAMIPGPTRDAQEQVSAMSYAPMPPQPYVAPGSQAAQMQGTPPGMTHPMHAQQQQQAMQPTTPSGYPQALQPASAGQFVKPDAPPSSPSEIPPPVNVESEEEPWSKFGWTPLPVSEIQGLAQTLTQACMQKVEPSELVRVFVEEHGVEIVSLIPDAVDLNKFIESIRTDPATRSTILATGRGKRFLEDVWEHIKQVAKEAKAQESSAEESEEESSEPSSEESDSPQPD